MRFLTLPALATLIVSVQNASASFVNSTACVDVHFVLARGTTESYPGSTYSLASQVAQNTTLRTNYENIIYPAVSEDSSDSYFIGRAAVGRQVTAYARDCPQSQIVILSYSQGTLIVGDALAGGGGNSTLGKPTQPLISRDVGKQITANVFYGNPRHIAQQPYDFGTTGVKLVEGKYPRLAYQVRTFNERYSEIPGDWCNVGDGVCSPSEGANALNLHMAYAKDYDTVAADWVLQKINAAHSR
ncbi:unnamed protein product [Penicillium salamii]|uniref:Cutinase n=1 Tax=Penicillium salamii TaxID=1612424 RepID=A0A9W4NT93_9EURO|nr:unnamed protein product [Penicillium salamii]CAG8048295.1 unnamed protein product [Penicillium salamii]CAG8121600.1 unnamed protein product [Penicillium salamii]CAG8252794.1 unnamed protein product [Penicillium salamii]CAG8301910.1 unnamed protein product [Penicillium salamii]